MDQETSPGDLVKNKNTIDYKLERLRNILGFNFGLIWYKLCHWAHIVEVIKMNIPLVLEANLFRVLLLIACVQSY